MLTSVNHDPKFIKHLVSLRIFDTDPLSVVDVGARGGFEWFWSFYDDQARVIGFEPDPEECNRLNQQVSNTKNRYFPVALDETVRKRIFYVAGFPQGSSLYKPDMKFFHRLPDEVNVTVVREIEINTVDLDSFSRENGLEPVEFIKLDVEGGELSVLKGSERLLKKSVIGLSIEVGFCRYRENMPVFSEVDLYLKSLGFEPFDLSLYRHARKALPEPRWFEQGQDATKRGQLVWGQALYLRDAVAELNSDCPNKLQDGWNEKKLLKLVSIMELFSLSDCAIELLQATQRKGMLRNWNVDQLADLLVPDIEGRTFPGFGVVGGNSITYKQYLEEIARIGSRQPQESSKAKVKRLLVKVMPRPLRRAIRFVLTKFKNLLESVLR